jgi:ParB family transcriptional regulator, chromosome partitioning protein
MRLPSSSATKRFAEQNAESIRNQGVLSPLLVRPLTEHGFEIVAGARRYRAAQMAEAATVPVRIVHLPKRHNPQAFSQTTCSDLERDRG